MRRNKTHCVAIDTVGAAKLGVADADGLLQHSGEHGVHIARRAADNPKHL